MMTRWVLVPWVLVSVTAAGPQVQWTQTARNGDGSLVLLQDMEALTMDDMDAAPEGPAITVDSRQKYQEFAGFGGAFTEASALNWKSLWHLLSHRYSLADFHGSSCCAPPVRESGWRPPD